MSDEVNSDALADSAGVPWAGRHFDANAHADDDGSADPKLLAQIASFRQGTCTVEDVVAAIASARFLVPLVAKLGEAEDGAHGHKVDKSAELAIVAVRTPDGEVGMPVFTSVAAMAAWNETARPVPAEALRVAAAAAQEGATRVIIDPGSESFFVLRRPAIWAIGRGAEWQHPTRNLELKAAIKQGIDVDSRVLNWGLRDGDPASTLEGAELQVILMVSPELPEAEYQEITERIAEKWSEAPIISDLVDSIGVSFTTEG